MTNTWWIVQKRYSQVPFPRRHFCIDNAHIIQERRDGLQEFMAFIIWLRYTCQFLADLPGPTRHKAQYIVNLISRFIEQPVEVEEEAAHIMLTLFT
ncbi:hypothetical protein THRCLA_20345 [Thraustotheca clavata]|uniref:Uncharacterized protein n=1 Tax=Thraustotheca clavata TaxID=74557 RepID=A0A1W0A8H0_9STRA|nr:hypothetical protein THRCLA_20345 [Thraustotheca clavata]